MYVHIYIYICMYIYLSTCWSAHCLPVHWSIYPSNDRSIHPSTYRSVRLCHYLFVCLSVFPSVYWFQDILIHTDVDSLWGTLFAGNCVGPAKDPSGIHEHLVITEEKWCPELRSALQRVSMSETPKPLNLCGLRVARSTWTPRILDLYGLIQGNHHREP